MTRKPSLTSVNKRLVKTSKLYFLDTGLATWLLGIQNMDQLTTHVQRGALFETWVISELLKARYYAGEASNLYFWRDRSGHEVDLLIDHGTHLSPLEIKSGQTINRDYFKGLEFWQQLAGEYCRESMAYMAVTSDRSVPMSLSCRGMKSIPNRL